MKQYLREACSLSSSGKEYSPLHSSHFWGSRLFNLFNRMDATLGFPRVFSLSASSMLS